MRSVQVAVVLAALALAGCTAGGGSAGGPSTTSPSSSQSPSVSTTPTPTTTSPTSGQTPPPQSSAPPLPGKIEIPADRIDASVLSDVYKRQAWVSPDGLTVQVLSLAGGCKRASAEVGAQSADQVRITLVTTYYPPAGGACTQELYDVPVDVTLNAPLGDRLVVLESREQTA